MRKKDREVPRLDLGDQGKLEEQLTKYMEEHPPKSSRLSKLDPVRHFIFRMHTDGYSHDQIAGFIEVIGIKVHSTTVGRYINKHANENKSVTKQDMHKEPSKDRERLQKRPTSASLDNLERPAERSAEYEPFSNNTKR